MNASDAFDTLGFRAHYELVAMVKALSMHQWRNTEAETDRLNAARWALRHREAYSREMRWRRDNPSRANSDIWTASERKALARHMEAM